MPSAADVDAGPRAESRASAADPSDSLLRRVGISSWYLLGIGALIAAVLYLLLLVPIVSVGVVLGLLFAPLFYPATQRLCRRGLGGSLSATLVLLAAGLVIGGLLGAIVPNVIGALPRLAARANAGFGHVADLLGLPASQRSLESLINENAAALQQGALTGAGIFSSVGAGLLLALTVLFFFLGEGGRIWAWVVALFPEHRRETVQEAGEDAWRTLGGYIRGVTGVAFLESFLVALTLLILGVPLVLPLAFIAFFGAYFPTLGSVIVGVLAAAVALVSSGLVAGLVVLALIIILQVLENTLYPRIVNSRAGLHPLATVLVLTTGFILGGPLGALLSVPFVAVLYSVAVTFGFLGDRDRGVDASGGTAFAP